MKAEKQPNAEEPLATPHRIASQAHRLLRRDGVYYMQAPEAAHAFLNVERYAERWPLIPEEELHASSVQHPRHPGWHWLLHSRRVPVLPCKAAAEVVADARPACAGIGDSTAQVWSCCVVLLAVAVGCLAFWPAEPHSVLVRVSVLLVVLLGPLGFE